MARYIGPKQKKARSFGEAIFGESKAFQKKNTLPGNMATAVAGVSHLITNCSCKKSKKPNTLMACLRSNFATSLRKPATSTV